MSCGPCRETGDCVETVDDEENGVEFKALTDLYRRLFESNRDFADASADQQRSRSRVAASERSQPSPPPPPPPQPTARTDDNDDGGGGSPMRRADRLLTAMLRRRPGRDDDGLDADDAAADAAAEGDVTHLTAGLPAFRSCRRPKPGTVNAALFSLDLERRIAASVPGDDRAASRAAYDLAAAEARCKHPGAVDAAELAVYIEPAVHLAETAARFGARWHADDVNGGHGGQVATAAGGGDSPVVVVAYVGNTGPTAAHQDR